MNNEANSMKTTSLKREKTGELNDVSRLVIMMPTILTNEFFII